MARTQRAELFRQLSGLPIFNPAVMKLMGISSESDSAIEDFERVFEADPALTTDLLLSANSAAFGGWRRIETIKHALSLLGLERVRVGSADLASCGRNRSYCRETRESLRGARIVHPRVNGRSRNEPVIWLTAWGIRNSENAMSNCCKGHPAQMRSSRNKSGRSSSGCVAKAEGLVG